jgi:hypothetical protein
MKMVYLLVILLRIKHCLRFYLVGHLWRKLSKMLVVGRILGAWLLVRI